VNLYEGLAGAGVHGEEISGPPWILGHRGAPREAPENTLSGLRRAVDLGLDGFEYDVRRCASGEAVLIHDAVLGRTTDGRGLVREHTLPELFRLDAGSWFARRFTGEPLPVLEEALEIAGHPGAPRPHHMIELKEAGLVQSLARALTSLEPGITLHVASFLREVVLEARDAGLDAMLLARAASEEDRRFVRDERIAAYGVGPRGWRTEAGREDWGSCERWGWSIDEPEDLLEACRTPLVGFNTDEPYRALATRALVALTAEERESYPLEVEELYVEPERLDGEVARRGEWYGSWDSAARVRNPFPVPAEVRCGLFFPSGAFEVEGVPAAFDLEPAESRSVRFRLTGGSRVPGGDPLFACLYTWRGALEGVGEAGVIRPGGQLLLDAPLHRRRVVSADPIARRLPLLTERPADPPASLSLRRRGEELVVGIENPGGLEDPHVVVHLDGALVRGGGGLALRLPADFDLQAGGIPFSAGIEGRVGEELRIRRWAGGIPEGLAHGFPGLLLPLTRG